MVWNKASETKPSTQGSTAPIPVKTDIEPEVKAESNSEAVAPNAAPAAAKMQASTEASPSTVSYAAPSSPVSAPTTIGAGLKIKGELTGVSDLFIDGEAQGAIVLAGSKVTIGANGRVMADIDAREIIVEGTVQGNLKASEGVHLSASSIVKGTVLTPRITIKDGAHLSARVEMARPDGSGEHSSSSRAGSVADSESPKPLAARAEGA